MLPPAASSPVPICFVHIPTTAGGTLRDILLLQRTLGIDYAREQCAASTTRS